MPVRQPKKPLGHMSIVERLDVFREGPELQATDRLDDRQEIVRHLGAVLEGLQLPEADIAITATAGHHLAELQRQARMPATGGRHHGHNPVEALVDVSDRLTLGFVVRTVGGPRVVVLLDSSPVRDIIVNMIQKQTLRRLSVAPCAPHFLHVGGDALGHIGLDDEADVRPVEAHAKGIRCDDDVDHAPAEGLGSEGTLIVRQPSVVLQAVHAPLPQVLV
mmetsp:Transcript_60856/g.163846  ORF Transcript_60856/g.163846 Transcript_60856/m.163846 type:complete len:219 (+) Transcript_60856:1461-2117(+)